jgi:Na+-translocating ferredoxin:NAD+ oxidoreductase RnfA subunit
MGYFELIISCIFVNNILLAQFWETVRFLGHPKKWKQPSVWEWR